MKGRRRVLVAHGQAIVSHESRRRHNCCVTLTAQLRRNVKMSFSQVDLGEPVILLVKQDLGLISNHLTVECNSRIAENSFFLECRG